MTGDEITESLQDFQKARSKARMQSILSLLTWKHSDLLSWYEVTSIIKPRSESYRGMMSIEVSKIIGSENRYRDFSSAFLPKKEMLRSRWASIDRAYSSAVILPPISVYSLGGWYFVRDGNHRVSVAKAKGVEFIDAEVVELDSYIKIEQGMTMNTLRKRVVEYERQAFIAQYKPDYLPMEEIRFTSPGSYPEMVNHILVHKYYENQKYDYEISFEEAARNWYETVYSPIIKAIREEHLMSEFPGQSEADMYMWLVRRWDERKKQESQSLSAEDAVKEEARANAKGKIKRYLEFFLSRMAR